MINKFSEFPDELLAYTDSELDDSAFADNVNRVFQIDNETVVAQTFEILQDNPYNDYSKAEMLYILDRACQAAENFDLNLDELLSESLGGEIMIDKNSPEFREAVEAELNGRVKSETDKIMADFVNKDKRAAALKELGDKLKSADEIVVDLNKDVETLQAEKLDAEKSFKEYKDQVEAKARLTERIDELKAIGMDLEDWSDTEEAVAEMSDRVFTLYKSQITLAIKHGLDDEGKNFFGKKKKDGKDDEDKDDKDKKKKKDDKAKGSTGIVDESKAEGTLPNSDDSNDAKDPFPALTKAFAKMRKYN